MKEKLYTIGEISELTGVSVKSIRHYCNIQILKPCKIDESNNYRYFNEYQMVDILLIKKLRELDFSLNTIKDCFITKDNNKLNELLLTKKKQVQDEIEKLKKVDFKVDELLENLGYILKQDEVNNFNVEIKNIKTRHIAYQKKTSSYESKSFKSRTSTSTSSTKLDV